MILRSVKITEIKIKIHTVIHNSALLLLVVPRIFFDLAVWNVNFRTIIYSAKWLITVFCKVSPLSFVFQIAAVFPEQLNFISGFYWVDQCCKTVLVLEN